MIKLKSGIMYIRDILTLDLIVSDLRFEVLEINVSYKGSLSDGLYVKW